AWGPAGQGVWVDGGEGEFRPDPPRDKAGDAYANFGKGIESQEGWFPFTVFSRESGEFVGTCSVVPTEESGCWDLGYAVHKRFWRQGYCTEMLTALMDWRSEERRGGKEVRSQVEAQYRRKGRDVRLGMGPCRTGG